MGRSKVDIQAIWLPQIALVTPAGAPLTPVQHASNQRCVATLTTRLENLIADAGRKIWTAKWIYIHFDRTPVRERIKAMAAELNELRQTVREGNPPLPELHRPDAFATIEPVTTHCIFAYGSPVPTQYSEIVTEQPFGLGLQDELSISIEPASPGPLMFSVDEISECYKIYYEHFHPHFPILNVTTPVGVLQRSSLFLFKTIITIVSQRFNSLQRSGCDSHLLIEVYQATLNHSVLSGTLSFHTIQAILLICNWPLPASYQLTEPSWLCCGVAMNAAGHFNLGCLTNKPLY